MTDPEHVHNSMLWQLRAAALEEELRESQKARRALEMRDAEFRDLLENSVMGMHWLAPDGTILWANRTELDLLDYEPSRYIGRPFAEFVYEQTALAELLSRLRAGENLQDFELRLRAGDGTLRWIRLDASPWIHNGQLVHTRCFVTDIARKKTADEAQMRLAAIVASSDDAIASKDLTGTVTSWNAAAERILGWTAEEMIGQSILRVIPPELHHDEVEILRKIQAGERIEHFETVRVTKSGQRIDVSLTISPVRDSQGKIIGAAKILRDITAHRKLEAALRTTERLASVGRLAATVAHEINNPLEAITNLIYLARLEPTLPENVRRCLVAADEELQRVSHIARQTLGFYRDTSAPQWISIAAAIEEVLAVYDRRFRYKEITLRKRIPPSLTICALLGEFKQIVSNLISNAIDACLPGRSIFIRAWKAHHPSTGIEGIRLVIADQGVGIPPENRAKIFMPFFTTKRDFGTGLGLWIIRDMLSKKGGSILCHSRTAAPETPEVSGTAMMVFLATDAVAAVSGSAVSGSAVSGSAISGSAISGSAVSDTAA